MKRHSKFLFLSLLVHAAILLAAIYSYKAIATTIISSEHKNMPISLNCIIKKPKATSKEVKKKSIKKPIKKIVPKKVIKKKVVKEKIVSKKIIKPIMQAIPQKVTNKQKTELKEVATPKEVLTQAESLEEVQTKECSQHVVTQEVYINHNVDKISQLISDNLYYPRSARKRGIQGDVVIKFTLLKDATISSIEVVKSNHEILTRAARTTIKRLSGKFPKPSNDLVLTVPINYTLH